MHIHARVETIDERPRFRDAFLSLRGLVAVRTFNDGRN
jgi:putative SOS response-associated peptidase YedK